MIQTVDYHTGGEPFRIVVGGVEPLRGATVLEKRRDALIVERSNLGAFASSHGFWRDLVTDDRGAVALDRFQIVAWTAILGGVFLQSVVWDLSMPDFSATTLALMGISSGTYIGFKLPGRAPSSSP